MSLKFTEIFYSIQFLDGLSIGILQRCIAPTVLKTGGNLMHLGFFLSIITILRNISTVFWNELVSVSSKKECLKYSLIICTILNGLLIFTPTFPGIIYNRLLFVFVHQIPMFCGQLSTLNEKEKLNPQTLGLMTALICSFSVGSILDSKEGFLILVGISTLLSGLNLVIFFNKGQEDTKNIKLNIKKITKSIPNTISKILKKIQRVNASFKNFNVLAIKFLLVLHSQIIIIFFVILIIINFDGRARLVNFVSAYQALVIFSSGKIFPKIRRKIDSSLTPQMILEKSCLICAFCGFSLGFSPTIIFYLLMFIPFFISRIFLEHYYKEIFGTRKSPEMLGQIQTASVFSEILSPILIGYSTNIFYINAYRFFNVVPILIIYYIVKNNVSLIPKKDKTDRNVKKSE